MKTITVIGSANVDRVIRTDRLPRAGETVRGYGLAANAGGKGLNQAIAAAKLGGEVTFLGAVGNDDGGNMLLSTLKENGVHFAGAAVDDVPTGTAMITVVNGDNTIVLDAGANACMTPAVVEAHTALLARSAYCVMQLEIPLDTVVRVCESGVNVVLNPAPSMPLPAELYPLVDILVPNEHEARDLTGIDTADDEGCAAAVKELMDRGVRQVVITLGARGCVYNDGEAIVFHPAEETDVVDTTSAGDCFIGALVTALASDQTIREAVAFATKAAAITVSRQGAAKSIPSAKEVDGI